MGAIVDTLFIEKCDLQTIKERYPECLAINQTGSDLLIQRYRVIIPDQDLADDSYYLFLVEKGIAMSSTNFLSRVESDKRFAARMTEEIARHASQTEAHSEVEG